MVEAAVESALADTEPSRSKWRALGYTAAVIAVLVVLYSGIFTAVNGYKVGNAQSSLSNQQKAIDQEQKDIVAAQKCIINVNQATSAVADADRKASDDLFRALLGVDHLTAVQVEQAYMRYLAERTANDKQRAALRAKTQAC